MTTMEAPSPERMSADEAAAKADALIAQYRATAPRAKRGTPRVGALPAFGLRSRLALLFVCAFLAGANWRAHAVWCAILVVVGIVLAVGVTRLATSTQAPDADGGR